WWLDAVCGADNWDATFLIQDNAIIDALPFAFENKFIFKLIRAPRLTPYLSCILDSNHFTQLVSQLPNYSECIIPTYPFHFNQSSIAPIKSLSIKKTHF